MLKLNEVAKENNIVAYGFQALKDYAVEKKTPNTENKIVISSLSPAVMLEMGISSYYAPVLPRGTVFNTAEDVYNADLSLNHVIVFSAPGYNMGYSTSLIVSRHIGTIEILKGMYPDALVIDGNVSGDDIKGAFVVGTLPPHLIQYAKAYQAVTINDFDYSKDGDLNGEELLKRLHISDPITVEIN